MTEKEQKRLEKQLKEIRMLGLPADKTILSVIEQNSSTKHKTHKQKKSYII